MAARVEDGVEVFLPHAVKAKGRAEVRFRGPILLEAEGEVSAKFRFVTFGIKRRLSALWRCECDFDAGILER
jgi:hypothetical protein